MRAASIKPTHILINPDTLAARIHGCSPGYVQSLRESIPDRLHNLSELADYIARTVNFCRGINTKHYYKTEIVTNKKGKVTRIVTTFGDVIP
jgi:hypothetical protein